MYKTGHGKGISLLLKNMFFLDLLIPEPCDGLPDSLSSGSPAGTIITRESIPREIPHILPENLLNYI
jgi:hypothetical protein